MEIVFEMYDHISIKETMNELAKLDDIQEINEKNKHWRCCIICFIIFSIFQMNPYSYFLLFDLFGFFIIDDLIIGEFTKFHFFLIYFILFIPDFIIIFWSVYKRFLTLDSKYNVWIYHFGAKLIIIFVIGLVVSLYIPLFHLHITYFFENFYFNWSVE